MRWRRRAALVLFAALLGVAGVGLCGSELQDPRPSVLVKDRHGRLLAEVPSPDGAYGYWSVAPLPPKLVEATLVAEDRRFESHPGVDPVAIVRALRQNWNAGRRVSGASTLAMQVARLQTPAPRTLWAKAREASEALALTARHGRRAVLRQYLRIAPYGNDIRGAAYAARRYFDKPLRDLSWAEASFLAALPQAPSRYNPFHPMGRYRATKRAKRILAALNRNGVIEGPVYRTALRQVGRVFVEPGGRRAEEALHLVLRLEDQLERGEAPDLAARGERILEATLDLDLQREVLGIVQQGMASLRDAGAGNAALGVVDLQDASVKAWVGSTDYFDEAAAGAIDYSAVPRSPGSALKPFFYALALDAGVLTPGTVLDDLRPTEGSVRNYDERFLGPMLPRAALANSRNVTATLVAEAVGIERGYEALGRLRLHPHRLPAHHFGRGMALGTLPVRLEDLAGAYTSLAGDGRRRALRWFTATPEVPGSRTFSEATARQITRFLADPLARLPSFPRLGPSEHRFAVAVKTGTSQNHRDAWTVAWSKRYLVVAWVGHPEQRPMPGLSGSRAAGRLVHSVLQTLHGGRPSAPEGTLGLADSSFPPPDGHRPVTLCRLSGHRAGPHCPHRTEEHFPEHLEAPTVCDAHRLLQFDGRSGQLATSSTPPEHRVGRILVDLPARYRLWAQRRGLELVPPQASKHAALEQPHITITSPSPGLQLRRDPEMPDAHATLALEVAVSPPPAEVLWLVDGRPFALAAAPYDVRWPLEPGEHRFEARLPYGAASESVRVVVR